MSNRARAAAAISTSGTARQGRLAVPGPEAMNSPIPATPAPPSRRHFSERDPVSRLRSRARARRRPARCPRDHRYRVPGARRAWRRSATQCPRSDSRRRRRPRPLPKPHGRIARSRTDGARSTGRRPPGTESALKCTPAAPHASATSTRSFTRMRVRVPRAMAMMVDTVAARSAVSRSRSRTWTTSIPASIA